MSKKITIIVLSLIFIIILPENFIFAQSINYDGIMNFESGFLGSCVTSSGAIIMSQDIQYTFQGTPHYKISPYFSNFAASALLDYPTPANLNIVKNWILWYFNHLNKDGSIDDYYVDKLIGGTDLPSVVAYSNENIPDFDSQDSYAATFLTLTRRYAEIVPEDTSWLTGYSNEFDSIGKALYAVVDDSNHIFNSDNNDGLTEAKLDYQIKYTMDNSEVNEGLRDMVWLEQNIISSHKISFYQKLFDNNTKGFNNLWNNNALTYYSYEGGAPANLNIFYPDATCQLYPIWTGVISSASSNAIDLYSTFNLHYLDWQNGKYYGSYPWTIICYVACVMNDTARVNSYLSFVQRFMNRSQNPPNWYNMESAFVLRSAKRMSILTSIINSKQISAFSPLLEQNYPNPFNPVTIISYSIIVGNRVILQIFDSLGKEVKTLINEYKSPGSYKVKFNASGFSSGMYYYRIQSGDYTATRKLVIMK